MKKITNEIIHDMFNKNREKQGALFRIRDRAYDLRIQRKSDDEVIDGALSIARIAIENGVITKEEAKNEIIKMLNANINNKTR